MSASLPPYAGSKAVCAKCGSNGFPAQHRTEWIPPGKVSAHGSAGECLERRCSRCGYAWPEAVR